MKPIPRKLGFAFFTAALGLALVEGAARIVEAGWPAVWVGEWRHDWLTDRLAGRLAGLLALLGRA